MNKAVLLDRDGVINANNGDIVKPEQLALLPGVPEAIRKLNDADYKVYVVTNQPHIAKGFMTFQELEVLHDKIRATLAAVGARLDAFYVCPHHPKKGFPGEVPEMKIECDCRKPRPGLLLQAIKEHGLDPAQTWMVGDSKGDVLAGQRAGVRTIYLAAGGGAQSKEEKELADVVPDLIVADLPTAVERILTSS
jgi:mannose-1-phosphate guanylyltransferase / phosphomannomutase